MCAFCFYHTEVEKDDRETVCENCGMEMMVYENGLTEVVTDRIIE